MKRVVFALLVCLPTLAIAQGPAPVTEEHKHLQAEVGTWDAEVKFWAAGPDADPIVSKASEVNKMMGPFWVVTEYKGNFGGLPFAGTGTYGYDPVKKKYVGTWIDNMSPHMSKMIGDYDEATKTLTMMSTGVSPDGKPMKSKNVSMMKDKDHKTFTMYIAKPGAEGEWMKMMEISYTRRAEK